MGANRTRDGQGQEGGLRRRLVPGALLAAAVLLPAACAAGGTRSSGGRGSSGVAPAAPEPGVRAGSAFPELSVDVAWLSGHLGESGMAVVDARAAAEYEKGHIPGAVSVPVVDTFDPAQPKNYPDAPERLAARLAGKGIGSASRVVAYDGGAETPAARLFWTLEYLGHGRAAVLDGGLQAWQAAGRPLATEAPPVAPATFTPAVAAARLHTRGGCEPAPGDAAHVMVDARSAAEWRGEDVRAKWGGRIPGAVNVDWREHFAPDARLKEADALRALYVGRGVTPAQEVIAYCQTGQRSSVTYWVLRLLGYPRVANYAGSWVEWGNDPTTPKAAGP